ncbi:unnamed protein product [Clonostachys byssicola]|uniref:F-box domain-containing protein n=1 Tax=Clonostachys byssicola TaxID=160290 RepID=A0A9N9UXV2_9HYPO|nr:unnamed protein product [Clonostachys byssicola]
MTSHYLLHGTPSGHVGLETLSAELLSLIVEDDCLSLEDLAALRLTCSSLNDAASAVLFRRIYISPLVQDRTSFLKICHSPRLAQHVREVEWFERPWFPGYFENYLPYPYGLRGTDYDSETEESTDESEVDDETETEFTATIDDIGVMRPGVLAPCFPSAVLSAIFETETTVEPDEGVLLLCTEAVNSFKWAFSKALALLPNLHTMASRPMPRRRVIGGCYYPMTAGHFQVRLPGRWESPWNWSSDGLYLFILPAMATLARPCDGYQFDLLVIVHGISHLIPESKLLGYLNNQIIPEGEDVDMCTFKDQQFEKIVDDDDEFDLEVGIYYEENQFRMFEDDCPKFLATRPVHFGIGGTSFDDDEFEIKQAYKSGYSDDQTELELTDDISVTESEDSVTERIRNGPKWFWRRYLHRRAIEGEIYFMQVDDMHPQGWPTTIWKFTSREGLVYYGHDPLEAFEEWDTEQGDLEQATPYGRDMELAICQNHERPPEGAWLYDVSEARRAREWGHQLKRLEPG